MIKVILLIIILLFLYFYVNKEHYIEKSYGYTSIYTPIDELCDESARMLLRSVPRQHLQRLVNLEKCNKKIESFQMVKYPKCTPLMTLTLFTLDINILPKEWTKFINHVEKMCHFRKLLNIKYIQLNNENNENNENNNKIEMTIGKKNVIFVGPLTADNIHHFVIENLRNKDALSDDGDFYTDCKKRFDSNIGTHFDYFPLCENDERIKKQ
jgi:hypothetical protein